MSEQSAPTQGAAPAPVAGFDLHLPVGRLFACRVTPEDHDPAAAPLVFLHEGLGSITQWSGRGFDIPRLLAERTGRAALIFDRLGFGRAAPLPRDRSPDYLYREGEAVLPQVLDATGIDRAVLIGHSDGGTIALLAAAAHPARVVAVVTEAAHVIVEDVTLAGIRDARAAYHVRNSRLRNALIRHHGDKTDLMFRNWSDVWLRPDFAAFDMTGRLPAVAAPVLAIQGERDEYGTPRQLDLIAAGVSGPCETWLVPECRHVPHFQQTEAVLDRITAFVAMHGR